ncbi:MAG: hypothetical protein RSC92_05745 [Clostridia bacterium]
MKAVEKLYKKENMVQRSIHLDDNLYFKLQHLSDDIFDATISKIINVCIEDYLNNGNFEYYMRPENVGSMYRSLVLRESLYIKLEEIKRKTGISFTRLLNDAIKKFLENNKEYFK